MFRHVLFAHILEPVLGEDVLHLDAGADHGNGISLFEPRLDQALDVALPFTFAADKVQVDYFPLDLTPGLKFFFDYTQILPGFILFIEVNRFDLLF